MLIRMKLMCVPWLSTKNVCFFVPTEFSAINSYVVLNQSFITPKSISIEVPFIFSTVSYILMQYWNIKRWTISFFFYVYLQRHIWESNTVEKDTKYFSNFSMISYVFLENMRRTCVNVKYMIKSDDNQNKHVLS